MMNRTKNWFAKIPITHKVTTLYALIVMFTVTAISGVLFYSSKSVGVGIIFNSLKNWSKDVEDYIKSESDISEDSFNEMLSDSFVDYIIENKTTGDVYLSANMHKDEKARDDSKKSQDMDNKNDPQYKQKNNSDSNDITDGETNPGKTNFVKRAFPAFNNDEYTTYNRNGREFISVENEFIYNGDLYKTRLLKSSEDSILFAQYIETRLMYINIIGVLFSVLVGMYISKVLLRPVKKIRETAERISVEDLSQRITIEGPDDEMKELSVTFNSMIDRLEKSFQQQSRFVSDASHELRTPISVIKGYANLINRWGKDDPVILQESVTNILEETDYMSVMIKNLLFLARSDQSRNHVKMEPMVLNDAVNDIARDLGITDEKIKINVDICTEELIIKGNTDLIKQMLWIYTENAVKYTLTEKVISFHLYKEGKYAYLSVSDNGCGISEEDIPHLFERFYRVDKSRNKEIPGNGLGLSIAKWIVDIHDGKIEIKSNVGKGTEIINRFNLI